MGYCKHIQLLGILLLATNELYADSLRIYRYVDNNGQTAFNSSIPADSAKNGYTILNTKGDVLEVVPPTSTNAELTVLSADQEQQRQEAEARLARKEADRALLRLYHTPADLERKRDFHLAELDMQIADRTAELAELDAVISELEQQPESSELARKQSERDKLDTELLTLGAKRDNEAFGFQEDIERLRYLQGLTENTAAN
ncbi:MAG: hypothetical protein V4628_02245 [Pseudomonadota bacterium]